MVSALAYLAAILSYSPDDGTQGHTPYYYKMDVPVRVRNSISYGRAWQLLRSRGAGSNATGPCDPPQNANSCNCSTTASLPPNVGLHDNDDSDSMPRCTPSALCGGAQAAMLSGGSQPNKAAILLVLDMQKENLRFPVGNCDKCLKRGYEKAVREVVRILISLRDVRTSLPIYLLASGLRYPAVEALLVRLYRIHLVEEDPPPVVVPKWASKWARGSFAKLRALALAQFDSLVVLDNDNIVLRNIDHLAGAVPVGSAPAFTFAWKCHPRRELRASTIVLRPNVADWQRASRLVEDATTGIYDDLGEQSVWRRLYRSVLELPAGYAALRTADLPAAEWRKVHVVHDAHLIHDVQRTGWHDAGMLARVDAVDKEASGVMREHFKPHFPDPFAKLPKARRGRGRKAKARG
jgi:hypothetical protein